MAKQESFYGKISRIQAELKAPKNQLNKFGGYNYRSCEDICEAVKPLLNKEGLVLTISDHMDLIGDRIYVCAVATITDGEKSLMAKANAREAAVKKGMDDAQITGSASSYARKYALNGLFLIDDTKDADHDSHSEEKPKKTAKKAAKKATKQAPNPGLKAVQKEFEKMMLAETDSMKKKKMNDYYNQYKNDEGFLRAGIDYKDR